MRQPIFLLLLLICGNTYSQSAIDSTCVVNLNRDTTFQLRSSAIALSFNQDVLPSLFFVPLEHSRAYGKYYIPFDTIAKVTGLYSLLKGNIIHPCCVCCSTQECAADVEFNRNGLTSDATFKISFRNIGNQFYKVTSTFNNFQITLKFDTIISGFATISPNFIRLKMGESRIFLTIQDITTGDIVEDVVINCISISPNRIVYMPRGRRPFGGTKLPMIIYN